MIISILIPNFWISVEEQRCPELSDRPVVIDGGLAVRAGGHLRVLMSNHLAAGFGVHPGISLAHARQLCPEAVFLSPEMPLYAVVWDEVLAILLAFTPLVETVDPGEAVCDVSGCERLFGDPVVMGYNITRQIMATLGLPVFAGIATNRLVAQHAARNAAEHSSDPQGQRSTAANSTTSRDSAIHDQYSSSRVAFIPPGREASFLAAYSITTLPEMDAQTLLAFQVLGIKTVEHLSRIPEKAMVARFGPLGKRLAGYARGQDDRPIKPPPRVPSVRVSRRLDDDVFDGLDIDALVQRSADLLSTDLASVLHEQGLTGRLLRLLVRIPLHIQTNRLTSTRCPRNSGQSPYGGSPLRPALGVVPQTDSSAGTPPDQFFPNQDSRIHSMLPQPKQPGRTRYLDPMPGVQPALEKAFINPLHEETIRPAIDPPEVGVTILTTASIATRRPIDEQQTISEITHRLLERILRDMRDSRKLTDLGIELLLEMSQFVPPEQLALPGLDGRPSDGRTLKLQRQERVLSARFGATPFRHLESLNLDSTLSERVFRWGNGMAR